MQKTLIKSLLAVAVAGTFATAVSAADLPYQDFEYVNHDGTVVPEKIHENFVFLNAGLSTAQGRLDRHDTLLTDAEGKVTSLGAQVTGLTAGLTTAEADILNNKNNILQNATNIADNTGRLTDAEGRLDRHDTRLMDAEGKVMTLGGKVTTLEGKVTTAESDILNNKNKISQNATNIADNTGRLTDAEDRLDRHDTRLTDAEGKVATLEGTVADHGTAIAGHDTRLTTAEGRIDLNSHAIADNYKEMKNNFAAVNSRIDKLDDKMKKGFASQAALNGLFQPYNVGKFNVSAAIGGYDSEQAMALGAGYRFNENFAIKAGIASDLSGFDHVTYNVGANFEF